MTHMDMHPQTAPAPSAAVAEWTNHASGRPKQRRWVVRSLIVGGVALIAYGVAIHYDQVSRANAMQVELRAQLPLVRTVIVAASSNDTLVKLPAATEAIDVASIYPRASGYVTQRLVDIGSRVKKGDLLAVIQSPELEQQLAQLMADGSLGRLSRKVTP